MIMSLIFDFADANEICPIRNPINKVVIPASEEEHVELRMFKPAETIALIERLPMPVKIIVLLVAATGVRISECLGLTWRHLDWGNNRILIRQAFRRGEVQKRTKTAASNAPVPMCEALAECLSQWHRQTAYRMEDDYVFASAKLNGRQPLWGQTLNAKFVRPAAVQLGLVREGERFGWHRFRHSLSTWANDKTKDITVGQTLLRHSKPDTTAIYTHGEFSKALDAQRQYMAELLSGKAVTEAIL
jgi:integrase